jgi:hypothetical protein
MSAESDPRLYHAHVARNREPILEVLRRVLPPQGLVLEVASGSGERFIRSVVDTSHVLRADAAVTASGSLTVDHPCGQRTLGTPRLPSSSDPGVLPATLCSNQASESGARRLNETFNRNCAQWGRVRATRLYWAEALQSLLPLLLRLVGRIVKCWTRAAS